jgi:hypothetical protein
VLDAFSRRVIGWALEDHLQASLAVGMALKARRPAEACHVQTICGGGRLDQKTSCRYPIFLVCCHGQRFSAALSRNDRCNAFAS